MPLPTAAESAAGRSFYLRGARASRR